MDGLKNKIWVTRKCRIIMESRLKSYARLSEIIIPYYSVIIICITIIPFEIDQQVINVVSVIGSMIIVIVSIILMSQKYEIKANAIKKQYIELNRLYFLLDKEDDAKIFSEYNNLLEQTDNHSELDYLKLKIQLENDEESTVLKPLTKDKAKYYSFIFFKLIVIGILFILPIFLIIILKNK